MKNVTPPDDEPQPAAPSLPRRRKAGRPPLLDTYAREVLLEALRRGNRLTVAARLAGVSSTAVEEWMRRGRGLDSRRPATPFYSRFVLEVEEAQAEAERRAVESLTDAIRQGDTRAAMWYLERQPGWRPTPPEPPPDAALVAVGHAPGANVIILSPDAVERLAREHLSAAREAPDGGDGWRAARARLVEDTPGA